MAGGEVVTLHGHSINGTHFGLHFHPSLMQMYIHQVRLLLFRQHQLQVSLLMMVRQTSMKFLMNAGRIFLTAARRVALCVHHDRVPPRLLVRPNGFFHKVQPPESIPYTSASRRCAQQQKAPSIRSVTQAKTIKWLSIRRSSRIPFTLQTGGSISENTISWEQAMNTSS